MRPPIKSSFTRPTPSPPALLTLFTRLANPAHPRPTLPSAHFHASAGRSRLQRLPAQPTCIHRPTHPARPWLPGLPARPGYHTPFQLSAGPHAPAGPVRLQRFSLAVALPSAHASTRPVQPAAKPGFLVTHRPVEPEGRPPTLPRSGRADPTARAGPIPLDLTDGLPYGPIIRGVSARRAIATRRGQ